MWFVVRSGVMLFVVDCLLFVVCSLVCWRELFDIRGVLFLLSFFGVCSLFVVGCRLSHVWLFFVVWRSLFVCLSVVVWWLLFVYLPLAKFLYVGVLVCSCWYVCVFDVCGL